MQKKAQKYKRNGSFVARIIEGGLVALDPAAGNLYTLNIVATHVWQYLWKPRTIEEISNQIIKKFSASPDNIRGDIKDFMKNSLNEKLLLKR